MDKKVLLVVVIVAAAAIILSTQPEEYVEPVQVQADVIMPNKSSRPGCEKTDTCYIPSEIIIKRGESVTWQNQDVAFHSVTSGSYDVPTDLFDSGHLDPEEPFVFVFDNSGTYDYFCTLHPWMMGSVVVEDV